jgi:hypothetical protein
LDGLDWSGRATTLEAGLGINQNMENERYYGLTPFRRVGVAPEACRAYEDTDLGMQAIRAAGMEAVDVRVLLGQRVDFGLIAGQPG